MFRKLVGPEAMNNVILVTTMWELVNEETGNQREAELRETFWGGMIKQGARMFRHTKDSPESAQRLIETLLPLPPVDLQIQREIVDEHKTLLQTEAGVSANEESIQLLKKHQEEIRKLKQAKEKALEERDQAYKRQVEAEQEVLKLEQERGFQEEKIFEDAERRLNKRMRRRRARNRVKPPGCVVS